MRELLVKSIMEKVDGNWQKRTMRWDNVKRRLAELAKDVPSEAKDKTVHALLCAT